jgi:hypothetical protein
MALAMSVLGASARADSLAFEDAWIRATPPGVETAAGYVTVENNAEPDRLVDAHSDAARQVEIHTTVQQDGLLKMVRLEALAISSGRPTMLEPGGNHIMFIGIQKPFAPGDTVAVTLVFERAGAIELEFAVRDARQSGQ